MLLLVLQLALAATPASGVVYLGARPVAAHAVTVGVGATYVCFQIFSSSGCALVPTVDAVWAPSGRLTFVGQVATVPVVTGSAAMWQGWLPDVSLGARYLVIDGSRGRVAPWAQFDGVAMGSRKSMVPAAMWVGLDSEERYADPFLLARVGVAGEYDIRRTTLYANLPLLAFGFQPPAFVTVSGQAVAFPEVGARYRVADGHTLTGGVVLVAPAVQYDYDRGGWSFRAAGGGFPAGLGWARFELGHHL